MNGEKTNVSTLPGDVVALAMDQLHDELIAAVVDNEEYADQIVSQLNELNPAVNHDGFHDGFHDYHLRGGAMGATALSFALAEKAK